MVQLSVLMSIYYKENPLFFRKAMESIWYEQTIQPDEIVLVEDGKLTGSLYSEIDFWKKELGSHLKIIVLEQNMGLAYALKIGLNSCSGEFIARMDTDDISCSQRFQKQIEFLKNNLNIDAVGTFICDIDNQGKITKNIVCYPLEHSKLREFFMKRDPIAHPTVMFRSVFFDKGIEYTSDLKMAEDTWLWYQAFLKNCTLANIDYVGLKFRRNDDLFSRRADFKKSLGLLKARVFKINRDLKFGYVADIYAILYFLLSISPKFIKKFAYSVLR